MTLTGEHGNLDPMESLTHFAQVASRGRWKPARHLTAIEAAIVETLEGLSAPILVIEAPPRHGKSELISRYLPAWYLGTYPGRRVILAGYAAGFARSWGRKARSLFIEEGPSWFGSDVDPQVRAAAEWAVSGSEGGMLAAGVGGPLTGRGADLLIVDDPIKNAEQAHSETIRENQWDWWQSTASTRLEPGGRAIIIATRWHEHDLSGRLIEAAQIGEGAPVRRLTLPAIAEEKDLIGRAPGEALWPERWPIEKLVEIREHKTAGWWVAMYQQRPGRHDGSLWPDHYFGPHLWFAEFPKAFDLSALAVDPSQGKKKGDYSAIIFAGLAEQKMWIDASIERRPPERMVGDAIDMALEWHPDVVAVESNAFQGLLAPEFDRQCHDRRAPPLPIQLIEQHASKEMRIARLGPHLDNRKLRMRETAGCRRLVKQLRDYPYSAHDDGPDALELAMRMVANMAGS